MNLNDSLWGSRRITSAFWLPLTLPSLFAALETLQAKPIVISSAAASQWGANVPELLWIDMERILYEDEIFSTRSVATSIGGYEDRGLGLTDEGMQLVREGIARNGLRLIAGAEFEQSIDIRMELYEEQAGPRPIVAYVNVGGGTVSVGRSLGKKLFHPGLNLRVPKRADRVDGVMPRFAKDGVPVVHLVQITTLAEMYGFPVGPTSIPAVGQADIFMGADYNDYLTAAVLVVILLCLYGFIRSDIGFRLLHAKAPKKTDGHPEPMV